MRHILVLIVALGLLTAAASAGEEAGSHHAPEAIDDARFQFLKGLEGTWTASAEGDEPERVFEFRVTAGGTAIEEREFAGSPMEMVTLYSMDGGDLVATHYCMLGNQPRLKAARKIVDGTLTFACAGKPGNAASHDDEHVHGWSMKLDGDGRLVYSADLVKGGRVSESHSLVLTRGQNTARR